MNDKVLLALTKILRAHDEKMLQFQAGIEALRDFVATATGSNKLEMQVSLAEAEHRLRGPEQNRLEREQIDALIQLLERGKDPQRSDG